ncbi:MAG: enoyl-CoA hydratase/isomerase family protein [Acidimicrobiia bacterium]
MERVRVERTDRTAVITIDNRNRANAFDREMTVELGNRLAEIEADATIRCAVLTGAGDRAFSSGHDLSELRQSVVLDPEVEGVFRRPQQMSTPVVAAVNGAAYAAGLMLVLSAPIRIASKGASFCASGARVGLPPVGGQLSDLVRLISPAVATEMLVTARPISAARAYEIGLVSHLTDRTGLMPLAMELAGVIAANSPSVVGVILEGLRVQRDHGSAEAESFERAVMAELAGSRDAAEGVAAFLERRAPEFEDRPRIGGYG